MNSWTLPFLFTKRKSSRVRKWDMTRGQKVRISKILKNTLKLKNNHFIEQLKLNWMFLNKCGLSLFYLKWKHMKVKVSWQINATTQSPMSLWRDNELLDALSLSAIASKPGQPCHPGHSVLHGLHIMNNCEYLA